MGVVMGIVLGDPRIEVGLQSCGDLFAERHPIELIQDGAMEALTDSVGLRALGFGTAVIDVLDGEVELVFVALGAAGNQSHARMEDAGRNGQESALRPLSSYQSRGCLAESGPVFDPLGLAVDVGKASLDALARERHQTPARQTEAFARQLMDSAETTLPKRRCPNRRYKGQRRWGTLRRSHT
jgi:hypothetical protein